jgi:hypothetical protein
MRADQGQATVEWIGLITLVSLLLGAVLSAAGLMTSGLALPGAIMERLVCAVHLTEDCREQPKLSRAYGDEVAHLIQAHAPVLRYEDGMSALPVDYRRCRADACAAGAGEGAVLRSDSGEPVVAFTHAIDCRSGSKSPGADCSGDRAGNLYLQYWFYYPGSATAEGSTPLKPAIRKVSAAIGKPSFHEDDWESYQVRIGAGDRRSARASSHHGYRYEPRGLLGRFRKPKVVNGWGPELGTLYVSGGSHAGSVGSGREVSRITKDRRLRLIPLRQTTSGGATAFAVTPPWLKRVYVDPEYPGTD